MLFLCLLSVIEKATGSVVISLFIISDGEGHRKCCYFFVYYQ